MSIPTKAIAVRNIVISAALIAAGLIVASPKADAQQPRRDYRIVGELSERDIVEIWAPARKQGTVHFSNRNGRQANGDDRRIALEGWIPDEDGMRNRRDEQQMKMQRGNRDDYPDYVSHAVETRSIVPKFWW